jgi:hypothetical protein
MRRASIYPLRKTCTASGRKILFLETSIPALTTLVARRIKVFDNLRFARVTVVQAWPAPSGEEPHHHE